MKTRQLGGRLRRAVARNQAYAARAAGVSPDAWNRMETGNKRIDALPLARFAAAYKVPAEYVISGRLAANFEDHVARVIAAFEAQDEALRRPAATTERSQEPGEGASSRTSDERSTRGTGKRTKE